MKLQQLQCRTAAIVAAALVAAASPVGAQSGGDTSAVLDSSRIAKPSAAKPNETDPGLAIALSLLIPGAGHLYLGETGHALLYGIPAVAGSVVAFTRRREDAAKDIGPFVWLGSWALSVFDMQYAIARHAPPRAGPIIAFGTSSRAMALRVSIQR